MLPYNVERVLEMVRPGDQVLDVGGWFMPFTRADWVIDVLPYETRAPEGRRLGEGPERFSEVTWIKRDICSREPFPFEDKQIDFVVCSHVLEDIRDPIFVCSELVRVAKAGYIETPSFDAELTFGFESQLFAGYGHHRWLCDYPGNQIDFYYKPAFVHGEWRYHFPTRYRETGLRSERLTDDTRNSWLFWEGRFDFSEVFLLDGDSYHERIERHIRGRRGYPTWRYALEPALAPLRRRWRNALIRADQVRTRG